MEEINKLAVEVQEGFGEYGTYSPIVGQDQVDYIDGLFHMSMLIYAISQLPPEKLEGGYIPTLPDLYTSAKGWIHNLLQFAKPGKFPRAFATRPIDDKYIPTEKAPYFVRYGNPAFAGPAAFHLVALLFWGKDLEAVKKPTLQAWMMCKAAPAFGYLVRRLSFLRQHVSSMFLAHMLMEKRPPNSMRWLAYENPLYLYQYGVKWFAKWPQTYRQAGSIEETVSGYSSFKDRKPGQWPAKNLPDKVYIGRGAPTKKYRPLCRLVCTLLQETI